MIKIGIIFLLFLCFFIFVLYLNVTPGYYHYKDCGCKIAYYADEQFDVYKTVDYKKTNTSKQNQSDCPVCTPNWQDQALITLSRLDFYR
jgi:hypothetical protein